ncbi:uncharacterized protein LOC141858239 isoform X1 [Brevipalpus obovatus]|uniref:uncharacterized protein LOC141858239 isoform X1 n=1 Tax=Brevipalpus obovatus TaxID=246614 RepID=UPI003D9F619A
MLESGKLTEMIASDSAVDVIFGRRRWIKAAKDSIFWASIKMFAILVIFLDLSLGFSSNELVPLQFASVVVGTETALLLVLLVCLLCDILLYAWSKVWMTPIQVTAAQRKLFRIAHDEIGFCDIIQKEEDDQDKSTKSSIFPKFSILSDKDSSLTTPAPSTPWATNRSMNTSFHVSTPNLSFVGSGSQNNSFNLSWAQKNMSSSPSMDENFVRKRMTPNTSLSNSIKDEASLRKYMRSYEEIEEKVSQMSEVEQQHQQQNQSPFSLQKSKIDLLNVSYQLSDDSLIATNMDVDESLSNVFTNTRSVDSICCRLNIVPNKLAQWTENMKNWICKTVLCGVVKDIDKINETLTKAGLVTSLVGEVGLSSLKQLSNSKSKDIPTLSSVLPYLELTIHQEYLINRLRDLSNRGCPTDFNWNRGADYKGKRWSEEWPTDAQIIMHCFCTYMNSKLPSNPNYPEAKAFTGQYFRAMKDDKNSGGKVQIHIFQTEVNPPHFNVLLKQDDIIEIPQGKNNVFYAIIVFLYFIKTKHYGFLGRVNLGPSGVNILCTIE